MKTAVLILDDNCIKVVYGTNLKCVKVSDLKLTPNIKFFDHLLSNYKILNVESVQPLSKVELAQWLQLAQEQPPEEEESEGEGDEVEAPILDRSVAETAPAPRKAPRPNIPDYLVEEPGLLFRSTEETTMVIDDLLTDQEIPGVPGSRRALAVFPYKAINLASLPKESVQASSILKRLIRDGKLVPCTPSEAAQLEAEHIRNEMQEKKAEQRELRILDRSVEDFVSGDDSGPGEEDVAKTIKVTSEGGGMESKSEYSLEELMRMTGAVDDEKEARAAASAVRAPRPERPRAPASDMAGQTIRRAAPKKKE